MDLKTIKTATTRELKHELKAIQAFLSDENSSIGRSDMFYEMALIEELQAREAKTK